MKATKQVIEIGHSEFMEWLHANQKDLGDDFRVSEIWLSDDNAINVSVGNEEV